MTNYEYDALYDELSDLEKETGTVLASSPTVNVGYEVLSDLPKEAHPQRMLSQIRQKTPISWYNGWESRRGCSHGSWTD